MARLKRILTLSLGLFLVVSVAVVAWRSFTTRTAPARPDGTAAQSVLPHARSSSSDDANGAPAESAPPITASSEPSAFPPPAAAAAGVGPASRATEPTATPPPSAAPAHKVVAMYFHGDIRCTTCRKVEAYAKEAVEAGFAEQVSSGLVEFRPVNVDREENRHFIDDYQLTNKSVVVVDEVGGKVTRWVKLDNVWGLVGDHDSYLAYVQDAVRAYVEN